MKKARILTLILTLLAMSFANVAKALDHVPVELKVRKALLGSGLVLQVRNMTSSPLPVKLTMINPTFQKKKVFDLVIDGTMTKEIGINQGWEVAPGDDIVVASAGYEEVKKHVQ